MKQYSCPCQGGYLERLQGNSAIHISTDKGWGPRVSLSLEVLRWTRIGSGICGLHTGIDKSCVSGQSQAARSKAIAEFG